MPVALPIGPDQYLAQSERTDQGAQGASRSAVRCFDRRAFVSLALATASAVPLVLTGSHLSQAAPPTAPFRSDPYELRNVSAERLSYVVYFTFERESESLIALEQNLLAA